ncbi:hypothetical protein OIHEL45_16194 [Sulfitobacter indolifex HEL-45]|uniref:Uncharacterized protein n=1 Tax=Sulfitobacter indolifex HEL-45 TaxID=391624 RepID=A0ABP2D959_9RHOB|nr:hypothetical protein OIHEL45_16194 [Sulfitobacter indolifex HEL-45]
MKTLSNNGQIKVDAKYQFVSMIMNDNQGPRLDGSELVVCHLLVHKHLA